MTPPSRLMRMQLCLDQPRAWIVELPKPHMKQPPSPPPIRKRRKLDGVDIDDMELLFLAIHLLDCLSETVPECDLLAPYVDPID